MGTVEHALEASDFEEANRAICLKLARLFDSTESARDAKALARELRLSMLQMQQDEQSDADTPLAQILSMAE